MIGNGLGLKRKAIISKVVYSTVTFYAVAGVISIQSTYLMQIFTHRTFSIGNSWIFYIIWGIVGVVTGAVLGFIFGAIHGIFVWVICQSIHLYKNPRLFRVSIYLINLCFPILCFLIVIFTTEIQADITLGLLLSLCFIAASLEISRQFMNWWVHDTTTPSA